MNRRLGIDLSGGPVAAADVRTSTRRTELRGFALLDADADPATLTEFLRRARRKQRFPRQAAVVAWPGDARIAAVRAAGFTTEQVITPGEALSRVVRMHAAATPVESVTAVVAIHAAGGVLAVVRGGHVLHETALCWSPAARAGGGQSELLRRYAFLAELTELLHGSFALVRRSNNARVSDILTCGSLPDLRSFTMPLAAEFDVDVETLDAADDFDLKMEGDPREPLREHIASLQLAVAAGRRWHRPHLPLARIARAGVPLAAAAAVFLVVRFSPPSEPTQVSRTAAVRSTPPVRSADQKPAATAARAPQTGQPAAAPSRAPAAATGSRNPETRAAADLPRAEVLEPAVRPPLEKRAVVAQPRGTAPEKTIAASPPVRQEPAKTEATSAPAASRIQSPKEAVAVREPAPRVRPAADRAVAMAQPRGASADKPVALPTRGPRVQDRVAAGGLQPTHESSERIAAPSTTQRTTARRPQIPEPSFTVASVLWSADRQLAVVDGRIVAIGDLLAGGRVVEISRDEVLVKNAAGRVIRGVVRGTQAGISVGVLP